MLRRSLCKAFVLGICAYVQPPKLICLPCRSQAKALAEILTRHRAPILSYKLDGNETLEAVAAEWGQRQRNAIFADANSRHSYLNYAKGEETVEQLYGYVLRARPRWPFGS